MATVKVKFRASTRKTKEGVLVYQVIHRRVSRQVVSGYRLHSREWDGVRSEVVIPSDADPDRRVYLSGLKQRLSEDFTALGRIVKHLDSAGRKYTACEVLDHFRTLSNSVCLASFGRNLVAELKRMGRNRTAERYTTVLNSFGRFMAERIDIPLDRVDASLMVEYESYLKACGVSPNSSSYYMRNLRAIYNRAVDRELTVQRNPFKRVYTGVDKTVKRAVPLQVIRKIRDLDLTLNPLMDYARDIFMFSFYTRGMSFIDMAFLKKSDLKNGILSYRRQKTGRKLSIRWEQPMQEILGKYDVGDTSYLLPIIRREGQDERRQYRTAAHLVNEKLKRLGGQLGLTIPLTMYVARHGWASIALSKNIPVSTISEAMGHDSENTTRIYLASLDTSRVDRANRLILRSL